MGANQSQPAQEPPSSCPMHNKNGDKTSSSSANPLNNMPDFANEATSGGLSTEREISTIPRSRSNSVSGDGAAAASTCPVQKVPDEDGNWVYPSPHQFQAALERKNKGAPTESVEMMVAIHNWLNEAAWGEIRRLEDARPASDQGPIELARFTGRPNDLSPKARWHLTMAKLFPESYSSQPPFDRHDWYIRRPNTGDTQRYVIDYYSAPNDDQGNPVFSLDVRQALDNPAAVQYRLSEWVAQKRARWAAPSAPRPPTSS